MADSGDVRAFAEIPADAVVLEVGLGGRFDATNIIDKPAVSVIMPISLDHQAYLGDRVELIAAEKAGIMKKGVPVVIGQQENEAAEEVLIATADRLGCPLHLYGQDYGAHEEHGRLVYQDGDGLMDLPLPALPGRHQYANAAAAISAVKAAGFAIDERAVETAMRNVFWPARLQRLTEGDLVTAAPEGSEIWLDGGHNPGAGEVIAEALAGFEERDPRPLYLIIGMINTKDPFGFFEHFAGLTNYVYCAPIKGTEAFIDPVALASSAADAGLSAEPVSSIGEALAAICLRVRADQPAPRILIGGSLYFAGNALFENGTPPL
nr:Mur ligase family protein [Marinicella sp. W31]MDC2879291.1 Mur ligase family protein [Marinicella sp. W31]